MLSTDYVFLICYIYIFLFNDKFNVYLKKASSLKYIISFIEKND